LPVVYFVPNDTPQSLFASQGRRIILSTGRGDTRLSIAEATAIGHAIRQAVLDQIEAETYERAGEPPSRPRKQGVT